MTGPTIDELSVLRTLGRVEPATDESVSVAHTRLHSYLAAVPAAPSAAIASPAAAPAAEARYRGMRRPHLRRGRVAALAASAMVAAAVAGLALSSPTGVTAERPTQMRLAASSVESAPDGTVVLTIRQLTDPEQLTAALKAAGAPALVELKRVPAQGPQVAGCAEQAPPKGTAFGDIVVKAPGEDEAMPKEEASKREHVVAFRPDRIPPGVSLHFVIFEFERDVAEHGTQGARAVFANLVQGDPRPCEPSRSEDAELRKPEAKIERDDSKQSGDAGVVAK